MNYKTSIHYFNLVIFDDTQSVLSKGEGITSIDSLKALKHHLFSEDVSLLIINRDLKLLDGIQVLKELRDIGIAIPILLISSKDSEEDIVAGFNAGCDDYVIKPYNIDILWAKIRTIILRYEQCGIQNIYYKKFSYIGKSNSFMYENKEIELTKIEKQILFEFFNKRNEIISRDHLINIIWKDKEVQSKSLNVIISRLREKIEPLFKEKVIRSVYGRGYIFTL